MTLESSGSASSEDTNLKMLESAGHPVVRIRVAEKGDLGQEFFRWELAVAAAGAILGVHPFNQPDVELAKNLARKAMAIKASTAETATPATSTSTTSTSATWVEQAELLARELRNWMARAGPGRYVAIQAYLSPALETTAQLQNLRGLIRDRSGLATTLGYGPSFLHSTGQLHKGGPDTGLFLQLIDEPARSLPVPETDFTFGALIHAQAVGDYQALQGRERCVLRVNLGRDVTAGLQQLEQAIHRFFEDGAPMEP